MIKTKKNHKKKNKENIFYRCAYIDNDVFFFWI